MKRFYLIFLILILPFSALAEEFDYSSFGQIPVQHDGRITPLDSLARVMLKNIYGSASYDSQSASAWLAAVFFDPARMQQARMFSVATTQAALMMGLPERADHLYSFEEIVSTFPSHGNAIATLAAKEKNTLSRDEAEAARIYSVTNQFAELVYTFSPMLPLGYASDRTKALLHPPQDVPMVLLDLQKKRKELTDAVQELVKRKGTDPKAYGQEERELALLAAKLSAFEAMGADNKLVRIIPPGWGGEEWQSPWAVIQESTGSPYSAGLFEAWRMAAYSYSTQNAAKWNAWTRDLLINSHVHMAPDEVWRVWLEYMYNTLGLLFFAAGLYAIGLLGIAASARFYAVLPWGKAALLVGLGLQATAIAMRMLILMRPPVSTLYESLLFVSFIVMAVSLWLGIRKDNFAALFAGSLTALLLLLASWVFAGDSDTLGVLVAVLNTNFWLATHVICITTGYGTALVTGAIAHIYLFRSSVNRANEAALAGLSALLHRAALIALLFTATGTMLGGIWADQSWGRFWGWDPKENGALLIVLWLVWLLHGRIGRNLSQFGFAAWMACINMVVALAWVGVNLLSVGLHSYGFTDVAATGLESFCAVECVFIVSMVGMHYMRRTFSAI